MARRSLSNRRTAFLCDVKLRSDLALGLGAKHDGTGALIVDEHSRTAIPGLYAAGEVVRRLDQVVVTMDHAAMAATDIHNRCEPPIEQEVDGAEGRPTPA